MAKYRDCLPHSSFCGKSVFLQDSGLETVLVYEKGIDMPEFAAFPLVAKEDGKKVIEEFTSEHIELAQKYRLAGFIIETPTWRASMNWAKKLGICRNELISLNKIAVEQSIQLREKYETKGNTKIIVCGLVGPSYDAYKDNKITQEGAEAYHDLQIAALEEAGADYVSGNTLTTTAEAIGISRAAKKHKIPVVLTLTLNLDGTIPNGQQVGEAIAEIEESTDSYPTYYGLSCVHPEAIYSVAEKAAKNNENWIRRIRYVEGNASKLSHEELDGSDRLHCGDPVEWGQLNVKLKEVLPCLNIFGGCCGTNSEHMGQLCISLAEKHML